MRKRGFLGGCFNPPTKAHLEIVKEAISRCGLDELIIVPMGNKYEKKELIDFNYRYQMLKLCFENCPNVKISKLQENQEKRTYAIDSFKVLNEKYKDSENFFIMGMDNFNKMHDWQDFSSLKEYKYIVFKRKENNFKNENFENLNYHIIDTNYDISSTMVRDLIKTGNKINNFVEENVEKYIIENKLYK